MRLDRSVSAPWSLEPMLHVPESKSLTRQGRLKLSFPVVKNAVAVLTTRVSSFGSGYSMSNTFSYRGKTMRFTSSAN